MKPGIDYSKLQHSLIKTAYKYNEVKDRLERVAFDLFKMKDGDPNELWQIQNADDGEYIVCKYSEEQPVEDKKASNTWNALVSKSSGEINIFYKGYPINKFASSNFGISKEDLDFVQKILPEKLASDKNFVKALLNTLDADTKQQIIKLYPELI